MSSTIPRAVPKVISIDLIDEPDIAMRQSFDPVALDELVADIRANGVIQSLALVENGERYRVAAGHRRRVAAKLAGLAEVPALVWPEGTPYEEVIKVSENLYRERVNPADEALYYERLLREKCGNDFEKLCAMVGQKESYVNSRLSLLMGYEDVFRALMHRQINLSVAVELNKYKDEGFAKMDLATAVETGATARYIIRLRSEREKLFNNYPPSPPAAEETANYQAPAPPTQECAVCGESHDPWNLDVIYVHRGGPCKKILARALGQAPAQEP